MRDRAGPRHHTKDRTMISASVRRYRSFLLAAVACLVGMNAEAADPWVVYKGGEGPGKGKHVVLISGDEEYRSEEALPQLGKILAERHGFDCTVLFAIGKDGTIDPNRSDNIPGLEALKNADLMIIFTRFRSLPADQMDDIVEYVESGRPIIGMRTATHAFNMKSGHPYAGYSWNDKTWDGGFGRQILGETWVAHHGDHGKQSTRGIIAPGAQTHPILAGIKDGDIWGPTDVYTVTNPLPGDSKPLVLGQVLEGMKSTDKPVSGPKNEPMMPVAWTKSYTSRAGKTGRVFNTTMGASQDLESEGVRRMLVNAVYWATGLESKITPTASVELVGEYKPHRFGFGAFVKGMRPEDFATKAK
jgi:type 1 glutamine amidotransferase